ncbi:MAG: trimethylamine methyltransferase family protein [Candidatus Aminicenantes bacterium]|nr:MAG: trimethylamine methyltransferase family protein [Candidatus Aminicenantes bacterium]
MHDKFRLNIPRLPILSRDQIERLHLSTLEVLRRTGVDVKEAQALEVFQKGGCFVDGERIRIPAHLVEWALNNTPPRISLCDRNGNPAMLLEENNVYFGTGSDTPNVIDPFTGERRLAVLKDIANVAKTVDFLDEMSFVMNSGIASDVDPDISDIFHFEAMMIHTTKPIILTAWSLDNLKTIIQMGEVVAGGEEKLRNSPFFALYTEPISPLLMGEESTQKLMFMAEKSLPVIFTPAVLTGGTGPVTIAGGLVQGNAEILAGYVLANLISEGAPFIYGGGVLPIDMSTSLMSYASPEFMLATSALTDMARYYRLPMFSFAGCSDSCTYDQQASLEGALWILLSSLSGGNLVHDVGYINNGLTMSFEQLVASNEVIGLVRRITRGFEISDETLALDLINEIGPGGEYLTSEHTLRNFRRNWFPELLSRITYERWEKEGQKDLGQRAGDKVRFILENHKPLPLDDNIRKKLQKLIQAMKK